MWSYQQTAGELFDNDGNLTGTGYSGSPEGKNDPSKQCIPDVGPIPRGSYTIGQPFSSSAHGPFVLPLDPDPANDMCGRSGFLIHGDSIEHPGAASEGCIIMPRPVRESVWNSGDRLLTVVQ
ncbi:MAG TPA: tlde1 domain-containing protein [Terracidiphilus sp.]|jgi:hypothetical protein|nr:tlde1 domain-containing protein [Terracidiphilus sp.]